MARPDLQNSEDTYDQHPDDVERSKEYLGDGVYADFDGYSIELTTENGIETTNRIYLEPEVYVALVAYVDRLKARKARKAGG